MREERSPAIVLRTRAHAESDKIVTCLSRDWGKISAIAKGAKRSRRRFVNVLEPFSHIQLRVRPSRSEELLFLLGAELIQAFRRPSDDLERFALASYIVELTDVMTAGREAGQDLYQLVLDGLSALEVRSALSPLFAPLFALQILRQVGYAPDFSTCQRCGGKPGRTGSRRRGHRPVFPAGRAAVSRLSWSGRNAVAAVSGNRRRLTGVSRSAGRDIATDRAGSAGAGHPSAVPTPDQTAEITRLSGTGGGVGHAP